MLPLLIYEKNAVTRSVILSMLNSHTEISQHKFSVLANTDSYKEAMTCLSDGSGILLLIAGINSMESDGEKAVSLEKRAWEVNRDNYVVYWLDNANDIAELASRCQRPAGVLLPPVTQERLNTILDRVYSDYASLSEKKQENFLVLQSGGTLHRISVETIRYIEAFDKKLNIYTERQCLSVYEKLSQIEAMLGSRFFRCHRSYLVNYAFVESANFAEMTVILNDGVNIPLSRSCKDALKIRMMEEQSGGTR